MILSIIIMIMIYFIIQYKLLFPYNFKLLLKNNNQHSLYPK